MLEILLLINQLTRAKLLETQVSFNSFVQLFPLWLF